MGVVSVNFFDQGSPFLAHPLLTEERAKAEIDEIERLTGPLGPRALDIGCGFGRHSIELASRGVDVLGIDPSSTMVEAARERAATANQFVDFQAIEAAELTDVARYDLAICLFTTLGQLSASTAGDEPHLEVLRRAKRALRPGAKLVVEVPEQTRAADALVETEQLGPTKVVRTYDRRLSVIRERFEQADGHVFKLAYRVFAKTELVDMLHDVGFVVENVLDRALVEPPMTFMTIVAQRPANRPA